MTYANGEAISHDYEVVISECDDCLVMEEEAEASEQEDELLEELDLELEEEEEPTEGN